MERFKAIVAAHLFLRAGDEILLLRRYNTGYEDGRYSVPAGHVDGGETVSRAMIREAGEECGIVIAPEHLEAVGVMHRLSDEERIDFFFAASRWTGEVRNLEPNKCDELSWHPIDALPANMIPYVDYAISCFCRGVWFSEYGWPDSCPDVTAGSENSPGLPS